MEKARMADRAAAACLKEFMNKSAISYDINKCRRHIRISFAPAAFSLHHTILPYRLTAMHHIESSTDCPKT